MAQQPIHSVLFDNPDYDQSHAAGQGVEDLQFYQTTYAEGNYGYAPQMMASGYEGQREVGASSGSFWSAFGTGGFADEPPLLEELGINFSHIQGKSLAVLNPLRTVDRHIMDDADLAGPLLFCFLYGMFLLLSGKPHFGYIYGVAMLGCFSLYLILNLMSEMPIEGYRVASVLGYCMLPMVILSGLGVIFQLDGNLGFCFTFAAVAWCTFAASGMFVSVQQMSEQRGLVAYPVGLFYTCFALMAMFTNTPTVK
ncbi:uncharacterized protein VTP21DRAFT_2894 [Calcarisporiella thermophila]|uniref:uncharacterized protein n=1 Tax=Calcarisporiella thermophila TaxID=911321 RepID=UPI003743CE94